MPELYYTPGAHCHKILFYYACGKSYIDLYSISWITTYILYQKNINFYDFNLQL